MYSCQGLLTCLPPFEDGSGNSCRRAVSSICSECLFNSLSSPCGAAFTKASVDLPTSYFPTKFLDRSCHSVCAGFSESPNIVEIGGSSAMTRALIPLSRSDLTPVIVIPARINSSSATLQDLDHAQGRHQNEKVLGCRHRGE